MISVDQIPLKYLSTQVKNLNNDLSESNLLSLSYGRIVRKDITSNEGLLPESFIGYNIVQTGDVVLRLTDMQNDQRSLRSGLVTERGIITSAYLTLRPDLRVDPRFLAYAMHALDTSKKLYALGGGLRQSLGFEELGAVPLAVPPLEEQRRIADFLDDQVARIDAISDARRRQLTLAQSSLEARCRTTFRALRQESSVDFMRLSWFSQLVSGEPFDSALFLPEGPVPLVRMGDLNSDSFELFLKAEDAPEDCLLKDGDVVVGMSGDFNVRVWTRGRAALNQRLVAVRSSVDAHFVASMLRPQLQDIADQIPNTTLRNLSIGEFRRLVIPLSREDGSTPKAARRIREFEAEVARLSATLQESCDRLDEYKRSMISAAVSGEFDVSASSGRGVTA